MGKKVKPLPSQVAKNSRMNYGVFTRATGTGDGVDKISEKIRAAIASTLGTDDVILTSGKDYSLTITSITAEVEE